MQQCGINNDNDNDNAESYNSYQLKEQKKEIAIMENQLSSLNYTTNDININYNRYKLEQYQI